MASILDDLLDSVVVKMIDPNEYERMVNEEIKKTKESLGLLANPSAEWPYVFHGDTIDLDWRFSTCVLSSKYEAHSISSVQGSDISLPNIFDIVNVPPIRTTYNREMLPSVGSAHEYATLIQVSNNDPIIDQKNRELCKTITSIIATAISVKAMMLLKLLRQ